MAGIITLYKNAALTQELSDGSWAQSILLPTISLPGSGTDTSDSVVGYLLNTGTSTMLDVYVHPYEATGVHGADFAANLQIAPDVTGSPGSFGDSGESVLVYEGELSPSQAEPGTNTSSPVITNPASAPTVSAISGSTNLGAGTYRVAYSYKNSSGETLISPKATITITAGQAIRVNSVGLITNATGVNYYISAVPGQTSTYLAISNSNGAQIDIDSVKGFARFWVRQVVDFDDPTGVYQAQLTVTATDIG